MAQGPSNVLVSLDGASGRRRTLKLKKHTKTGLEGGVVAGGREIFKNIIITVIIRCRYASRAYLKGHHHRGDEYECDRPGNFITKWNSRLWVVRLVYRRPKDVCVPVATHSPTHPLTHSLAPSGRTRIDLFKSGRGRRCFLMSPKRNLFEPCI